MRIVSPLKKKKYLHDLRCQMESWFMFGEPRFTGMVLGNFLYITHHAGCEWGRYREVLIYGAGAGEYGRTAVVAA